MRLKTMLLAIMMAVAPMTVVAQVPADVQQIIDEANAYLPVDAGGGMTMTSLGYDHSSLVYTLEFDDDPQGLTINMMDSKVLKQSMLNTLKGNSNASVHVLFQVMEAHNLGMTYAFHGRQSKKTILVSLTLDEVRNALGSAPSSTSKSKLQGTIDMMNAMFPMPSVTLPFPQRHALRRNVSTFRHPATSPSVRTNALFKTSMRCQPGWSGEAKRPVYHPFPLLR